MTPGRRAALLAELASLTEAQREEDDDGRARRHALRDEYVAALPRVRLARCPFTDAVVTHSLDTAGLDGPWWRYEDVVRPAEDLPRTFFALTGAVRLGEPVEDVPFLVKPGPEAPYVIPRILRHKAARAVVAQVGIGAHTGYAVTYFADPVPPLLARVNAWGANEHWFTDEAGTWWDASDDDEAELDFDLAPWIASGALRWVAPGDAEVKPRTGLDGCPFVGLPGRRSYVRVQDGVAWTADDLSVPRPRSRSRRSTAPA